MRKIKRIFYKILVTSLLLLSSAMVFAGTCYDFNCDNDHDAYFNVINPYSGYNYNDHLNNEEWNKNQQWNNANVDRHVGIRR